MKKFLTILLLGIVLPLTAVAQEGEPYVVTAIGYENGEINSEIGLATFILRGGDYFVIDS